MQFLRVISETKHPDRRLFYDADEVYAWLAEKLNAEESARLRVFLTQPSRGLSGSRR